MTTQEKILDVATEAFARQGYEGVRVDALVKEIGINKATFYYHFKGKHEVYKAVIKNSLQSIQDSINSQMASCATYEEKIYCLIDLIFARDRRDVLLIMRELIDGGDKLSDELYMLMYDIQHWMTETLQEGKSEGAFKSDDPFLALYIIVGVSDFYLSTEPFRKSWERFNAKKNMFYKDISKELLINNIKKIVIDLLKNG